MSDVILLSVSGDVGYRNGSEEKDGMDITNAVSVVTGIFVVSVPLSVAR
jgi:hypothetical protein